MGFGGEGEDDGQRVKKPHMSVSSSLSSSASIPRALKPTSQSGQPPARPPSSPAGVGVGEGGGAKAWYAAGVGELCLLLRQLGTAYRHLCLYRAQEALRAFGELHGSQFNTGWVQAQIATAHFNMAQHQHAEAAFRRCRQLEPHRSPPCLLGALQVVCCWQAFGALAGVSCCGSRWLLCWESGAV